MKVGTNLAGRRIWVTGGAGYLGSAITLELDRQGAEVLCIDLPGKAAKLVKKHRLQRTSPLALDVQDPLTLSDGCKAAMDQYGVPDGVAHLAFASSSGYRLAKLPPSEFQRTIDRTLTPTFVLCRELAERMKPRGSGSIVLFSSMYGVVAPDPSIYRSPMTPNPVDYGIAKAAVIQCVRYFAVHYGPTGVRFNCITPGPFPNRSVQAAHPGFIKRLARKTAMQRIGQNPEIVGPTLFLLGDGASFVTGHSLVVDGGWTAW